MTRGISSALAIRSNKAQIANIEAQTAKTDAERKLLEAETPYRLEWWKQKPEEIGVDILGKGMRWRVDNLTREFLDMTLKDRIAIAGLEREELQTILAQLRQEIELRGLDRAPLEAQAAFAKSWFGRNVAPAVGSAQGVAGLLTGVVAPFLRYFEEKGRNQRDARPRTETESKQWDRKGSSTIRRRY